MNIVAIDASADLSTALLSLTGLLLAAATAWALLIVALASWRPTARWAAAMTPRVLRAALVTGVSGAVALGPARAHADDLDGLPLPDRPVTSTISDQRTHTVIAGESLWSIATSNLPPGATPADIAAETPRWYLGNRTEIGDDPDLIHPGLVLTAPDMDPSR